MKRYDLVGVGNALVDVLAHVSEEFLAENDIGRSVMTLIDRERAAALYAVMGEAREVSGGSAANTIAGAAMLGVRTAYVGKVKDDFLGQVFAHGMHEIGSAYETPRAPESAGDETGRCIVTVTPDGERSMSTYLGVSEGLGPDDIDEAMMASAEWVYLEGYRFDGAASVAAFDKTIAAAKGAGGRISLTLSDPFCVDRHRGAFRKLIAEHVDLLFANEHEIRSLYETDDLDEAIARAQADLPLAAITAGARGAYIATPEEVIYVPAEPARVTDATGAGDLFASGFLAGLIAGRSLTDCGRMGCIAAGEIISHIGARPEADLRDLMKDAGL